MFDPLYLLVIGAGMLISFWASARVKSTFAKYSAVRTSSGMNGCDVAQRILADHGIPDVAVEPVAGQLSDHYDPRSKHLRLSEVVYGASTVAAVGVAAHEVGHAIQHARNYPLLRFRSAWVPVAGLGGKISIFVLMAAAALGGVQGATGGSTAGTLAWIGVALFATTTVFTLVTLPVEFDASKRALATLEAGRYLTPAELDGAKKVLNAAAMTYVAAAATSLMTLFYWAWRLGLLRSRRDD